jgi:hypothetical protein
MLTGLTRIQLDWQEVSWTDRNQSGLARSWLERQEPTGLAGSWLERQESKWIGKKLARKIGTKLDWREVS